MAVNIELGGGISPVRLRDKDKADYISIDILEHPNVDIRHDLRKGIPYNDESVENIYTCEFLEHLTYPEVKRLLKDCYRVLIPNGRIFITCPDFDGAAKLWIARRSLLYVLRNVLGDQTNPYDYHRTLLCQESIEELLKETGFINIKCLKEKMKELFKKDINMPGELRNRNITLEDFIDIKIYVEAFK